MKPVVAVIGSSGQLGFDLVDELRRDGGFDVAALDHSQIECRNLASVRGALAPINPKIVINCAAYVRVDDCETHVEKAFAVNTAGAFVVARQCAELAAKCVYISTDYVFDGAKASPYEETDITSPVNVYGVSKLAGEHLVRQAAEDFLIVRLASVFGARGARGKGGNFIETILAKAQRGEPLRVVDDIRMSPSYCRDAARLMIKLLHVNASGVIHGANAGSCTWYEFACKVLKFCNLPVTVEAVPAAQFPTPAKRPKNSALASARLAREFGIQMPSWQDALRAYLIEKGHTGA